MIGYQHWGANDWTIIGRCIQRGAALWGRELCLHGAVAILMLKVPAIFTVFAVASKGGAGNDTKFAGSFAVLSILCGAACRLGRDVAAALIRDVHGVAPTAIAWRDRSLAFNSAQHDQVDAASIPALVRQVTVEKKEKKM